MEVIGDLYRECEQNDGWCFKATTGWTSQNSAGYLYTNVGYWSACAHTRALLYRNQSLGFSKQYGRTYTGSTRRHAALTCPN